MVLGFIIFKIKESKIGLSCYSFVRATRGMIPGHSFFHFPKLLLIVPLPQDAISVMTSI